MPAFEIVPEPKAAGRPVPASPALWPRRSCGGMTPGALARVKQHVEAHLSRRIPLQELAGVAQLSERHFSRAFRQSTGVSPRRYLYGRRIERAAQLVRDRRQPLAQIAVSLGFADQSHFTRQFARFIGETPLAFRRRHS